MARCIECIWWDHGFCYAEKDRQGYRLKKLVEKPNENRQCDNFMGWREILRMFFLERRGERPV